MWQEHTDRVALRSIPGQGGLGIEEGYAYGVAKRRKHQAKFRNMLFKHYPAECFVCGFNQVEILEAAHIIPDSKGGPSTVDNGRLLCPNHHRAHDAKLFILEDDLPVWNDEEAEFLEPVRPWGIVS